MGREIRRVPKGWDHPRDENGNFKPLYDLDYETASEKWLADCLAWSRGEHEDQKKYDDAPRFFWDWDGGPPSKETHRTQFAGPATCYQIYETVSEGTPASPVFETVEAMVEWMTSPIDRSSPYNDCEDWQSMQGMTRAQAERFCKTGSSCSMMCGPGGIVAGHRYDAPAESKEHIS